jgi:probable phosphoglycerate mutase
MAFILLVRHGQNDWVSKKRLAGWTPGVHLNEEGRQQANELAIRLAHLPISAVYSSPLERCMETAERIAQTHGLKVIVSEAIGESRYGKWEGKRIKKLTKKKRKWHMVQHYPSRFRFPGGESFSEIQDRAVKTLEVIADQHEKEMVVVVSHADVIKLILAHYIGLHIDLFQRIPLSTASVSLLSLVKNSPAHVLRINDNGPIQPPPKSEENNHEEKDEKQDNIESKTEQTKTKAHVNKD